jgi:hypothetical protein
MMCAQVGPADDERRPHSSRRAMLEPRRKNRELKSPGYEIFIGALSVLSFVNIVRRPRPARGRRATVGWRLRRCR